MNITFEIANETILAFTEVCNMTFLEQVKTEVIREIYFHTVVTSSWLFVFAVASFIGGWLLAGWNSRRKPR